MTSPAAATRPDGDQAWQPRLARLTVVVLLAAIASLVTGQLLAGKFLYADGFREAEQRDLLARARHAQAVLRQGFSQMTPGAADYGDWDATYEYVRGRNPDYPTDNWHPSTLQRFQADLVFIVDAGGRIVLGRSLDRVRESLAIPPAAEATLVQPGGRIWAARDPDEAREGYVARDGLAYQWAAAPVLPYDRKGSANGWLILLRRLDAAFVADLDRTLDSKAAFEIVDDPGIGGGVAGVPLRADELRMGIPGEETVDAAFTVGSLGKDGSLAVRLTTERPLIARFTTLSAYFFWVSLGLGGLIAALATLWVRRRLLLPLGQISERLKAIGEELDLSARLPPLGHRDEISGVAIAANRLLEQIQVNSNAAQARDAALAASRSKSEFLARMSHEIRTPMNGVLGMTELLRGTRLDSRQQKYAETIRHSAESLLAIINDILDFSRIEAGKMALDDAPFDLEQVVEEAVGLLAGPAHARGLELICRFPPGLHPAYRGDGMRLRQVLINLLGNAVKFTERGQVTVRVRELAGGDERKAVLRFSVEDTGVGIRPESQRRIFESFTQEDGSTTRKYGGTGLGLAISKQLVELMGGQIEVRSEPGVGSTFSFTVPLAREARSDVELGLDALGGRRILVVDDNATNRAILREHLLSWGAGVTEADSGVDALAKLSAAVARSEPFDLVVLDYQMPEMNGLDVLRAARAAPELRDLRVVLLSSMNRAEEDTDWRAQRVDACLTKPVRRMHLYTALSRVIAGAPPDSAIVRALKSDDPAPGPAAGRLGLRVLLVEDNPVNQQVAVAMLEQLGCEVTVAGDGAEGARAFEGGHYDVVLMDCQMPTLDGYGATARIRAYEKAVDWPRTPVVALTANALEGDREKCLQAGMDAYLTKPFTQNQLRRVLEDWEAVPTEAQVAGGAVLDPRALEQIRALQQPGAPDLLGRIIALYLENSRSLTEKIREALAAGDANALREAAHALKSSSANVGATGLVEIARQLEALGRDGKADAAGGLVDRMSQEHARVISALQNQPRAA
ncbi:MAG: response regulator [Gammaproteobacteria bacterium]|nr:response regulator [Gammaproteobacteria bacterium]